MLGIEPVIEKLRTLENATLDRSVFKCLVALILLINKEACPTQYPVSIWLYWDTHNELAVLECMGNRGIHVEFMLHEACNHA